MADMFELEVLAKMPNYYGWIMETFAPFVRGDVVEYGAGTGTISQRLAPLADRLIACRALHQSGCGSSGKVS
jgi:hypothetical protein